MKMSTSSKVLCTAQIWYPLASPLTNSLISLITQYNTYNINTVPYDTDNILSLFHILLFAFLENNGF